jgi:hypothetical protein
MAETIEIQLRDDFFGMDWYDPTCYASEILDAKYEKVLVDDVIDQLDHLNGQQKTDRRQVLSEHTKLFDGTLGVYPHRKLHIDLVPRAVPKHFRSYAIPVIHLEAFKKDLIHLFQKVCYLLKVPVNGHLQPSSLPRKMVESVGSVT